MGLDVNGCRFLVRAGRNGVDFSRCATLGRQDLLLEPWALAKVLQDADPKSLAEVGAGPKADRLLRLLGANELDSVDYSSYEGASIIHDMNGPIPSELEERFSVVLDGGTLEHVFHFPTAIWNCMKMVRKGGHFVAITPGNNFLGHGFYQFSPELYFSLLVPQNGFEVEEMLIVEDEPFAPFYAVARPAEVKRRVELRNSWPTYLMLRAKKLAATSPTPPVPQQSDYVAAWEGASRPRASLAGRAFRTLERLLPTFLSNRLRRLAYWARPRFPSHFYRRVED